jgi:hypothetical protein
MRTADSNLYLPCHNLRPRLRHNHNNLYLVCHNLRLQLRLRHSHNNLYLVTLCKLCNGKSSPVQLSRLSAPHVPRSKFEQRADLR